jgi:hypothetical protein
MPVLGVLSLKVRRHNGRRAAQKCKGIGLHAGIAHRQQFLNPILPLLDQDRHRVGPVRRRGPLGLSAARHALSHAESNFPSLHKGSDCAGAVRPDQMLVHAGHHATMKLGLHGLFIDLGVSAYVENTINSEMAVRNRWILQRFSTCRPFFRLPA